MLNHRRGREKVYEIVCRCVVIQLLLGSIPVCVVLVGTRYHGRDSIEEQRAFGFFAWDHARAAQQGRSTRSKMQKTVIEAAIYAVQSAEKINHLARTYFARANHISLARNPISHAGRTSHPSRGYPGVPQGDYWPCPGVNRMQGVCGISFYDVSGWLRGAVTVFLSTEGPRDSPKTAPTASISTITAHPGISALGKFGGERTTNCPFNTHK